jgi:hypothetical protein
MVCALAPLLATGCALPLAALAVLLLALSLSARSSPGKGLVCTGAPHRGLEGANAGPPWWAERSTLCLDGKMEEAESRGNQVPCV